MLEALARASYKLERWLPYVLSGCRNLQFGRWARIAKASSVYGCPRLEVGDRAFVNSHRLPAAETPLYCS